MICYHYCGLESFVNIVRQKTLRLSNIFYMNDYKEVSWFFDIARKIIEEYVGDGSSGRSAQSSGASSEDDIAVSRLRVMLEREPFDHIYAACFSQKDDDLSQWRGYADDGRGVAIGVELDVLRQNAACPLLEQLSVEYDDKEQRKNAEEILMPFFEPDSSDSSMSSSSSSGSSSSGSANRVFRKLARLAPCYKNPAFQMSRRSGLSCGRRCLLTMSWSEHDLTRMVSWLSGPGSVL